jgi:hypothetical protein
MAKSLTKQASTRFSELVSAAVFRLETRRSRALVPLPQTDPPADELDKFSGLGAVFLAHLIAMRDRAPQTLKQYRGLTGEAIHSYEHAAPNNPDTIPIRES